MFDDIKLEIMNYGKYAWEKDLSPGVSGNISVKSGNYVVITSSGSANGFLSEEDIVVVDFDGNLVDGNKKASSEKLMHIEIYKMRKDINAICHFHSPYLTSYAISGKSIDENTSPEIVYSFGKIPCAEYAIPGSSELASITAKIFDKYCAVIMKNHGFVSGGKDLKDAYLKAETCEYYAKSMLLSNFLGGAKMLNEEQVKDIYSLK